VTTSHRQGPSAGFTLIELLIVIAILATLVTVLMPAILGADDAAKETATETTMMRIEEGCKRFAQEHGYFPPDDFKSPEAGDKTSWKSDNGQNTGIESFVAFCSQSRRDGMEMGDLKLTNSDKDQHGVDLPMLHTKERMELADAWGTPFAYFGKFGMEKAQSVVSPEDELAMPATAKRRPDGTFHAGKYQILSAGKDKIFGTPDDLVWPKN